MKSLHAIFSVSHLFFLLCLLPPCFIYSQPIAPTLEGLQERLQQQHRLSSDEWGQYTEKLHELVTALYEEDAASPEIAAYGKRYLLPYQTQLLAQNHPLTPSLIHNSCKALYEDKQYEATIHLIEALDQIKPIEQISTLTPTQRYYTIIVFRDAYSRLEKHGLAINLCRRALSFLQQEPDVKDRILRLNFLLGEIAMWEYKQNKDWATAANLCQQMERNCRKSDDKPYCYIDAYKIEADLLTRKGDYEKAKRQFNKCFDIIARNPGITDSKKAKVYSKAARAYYYSGDLTTAVEYFKKSLDYDDSNHYIYGNIGSCYSYLGKFDEAEKYLKKDLALYGFKPGRKHPLGHLERYQYNHAVALYLQGDNYQMASDQGWGTDYLYKAQPYFEYAVHVIEQMSQSVEDAGTGRYLINFFYNIIEQSINNRYKLYEHTDSLHHLIAAYDYAERSKGLLLKEAVQRSAFNSPLPEALAERRRQLEKRTAYFENRVYEREEQNLSGRKLADSAVWAKQKYHNFMDSIERAFPSYKRMRVKHRPLDITAIQQQLARSNQGLIHYFAGYEHLYMFRMWEGHLDMTRTLILESSKIGQNITRLRNSLYEWAINPQEEHLKTYRQSAYQLYTQIFAPLEEGLPKRLVIVSDGILQNIPFDVLLTDSVDASVAFNDYPYLIKDYQISYAHSSYLQFAELPKPRAPKARILGFAPSFEETGEPVNSMAGRQRQMGPLLSNTIELEQIADRFPLDPAIGTEATRQRFLDLAPQYSVLHLATHAKANNKQGESSFLCFAGAADSLRRLYTRDLYTIDLNADLVVLSACETGIGQLAKGEGNISLARGFAQAGARSLVNTLWRVSDQASAELMAYFYTGLKEGLPKDEALRNAKLQYLAQAPADQCHPFFWGAYVGTGDMSPLELHSNRRWWWIGGLLLMGGLFVFSRRRRSNL